MNNIGVTPSPGFIVIEGPDYSGKTTVAEMLEDRLRNICHPKHIMFDAAYDPGCTTVAEELRRIVKSPGANLPEKAHWLLFQAARIDLQEKRVRPCIDNKGVFLMQRWTDSTRVYQGMLQGIPQQDLDSLFKSTDTLAPHMVIVLDVSDEEAERRYKDANRDEEDYFEKEGFRQKIRTGYRQLPRLYRHTDGRLHRSMKSFSMEQIEHMYCRKTIRERVDADAPIETVVESCFQLIMHELDRADILRKNV